MSAVETPHDASLRLLADRLWDASASRQPVPPLREEAARLGLPTSAEHAYAIQRINRDLPNHPSATQLTGVYHNLLRTWAEL